MGHHPFDPETLRRSCASLSADELLAIVSIDSDEYTEEAVEIARTELHERGYDDSRILDRVSGLDQRLRRAGVHGKRAGRDRPSWWMYLASLIPPWRWREPK